MEIETQEKRFRFNKTSIAAVTCPAGKTKHRVYDTEVPGLSLLVTQKGAKTYYLYRFVNGKPMEVKIEAADKTTPEKARERARELNGQIVEGKDPAKERVANRVKNLAIVPTLEDLWNAYRTEHLNNKKPGTAEEFTRIYDAHLAPWKGRPLSEVTKDECRLLHKRIGAKSRYTANRVLAILSAMFRAKGGELGMPEDWTPTAKIKRFPEHARDRVLSPEELAAVLAAIDADENELVRDYFRMMIYTGSRKGKLAEMAWQQVSLQRKTWTVPGVSMKNGAPLVVNLIDDAVEILKRRTDTNPSDSPYVFHARLLTADQVARVRQLHAAGTSTRKIAKELGVSQSATMRAINPTFKAEAPKPFNGAGKAWERILKRAKITTRTTPHDLRRTFVTGLLESGAPLMHVAASVGHRSMETTTKHYSVARQSKVADAVKTGVAAMLAEAEAARVTEEKKRKAAG